MTNAELAGRLGVAPSTAHTRLRALVDRGVITGFHASVDERMLGAGLQAVIGVTLRPSGRRESIVEFADRGRVLPQVIQVFFLGGDDDFLLHIAVADSSEIARVRARASLGPEQRRLHSARASCSTITATRSRPRSAESARSSGSVRGRQRAVVGEPPHRNGRGRSHRRSTPRPCAAARRRPGCHTA